MAYFKDNMLHRVSIAEKLNDGKCNGTYSEAILILSSIINAIGAYLWPKASDRRRFVETIVRFTDSKYCTKRISLFLLLQKLEKQVKTTIAEKLRSSDPLLSPWESGRIQIGDDIDKYENEILEVVPELPIKIIREYSYANILYKEIRCGLVHKYRTGKYTTNIKMTSRDADISYTNVALMGKPEYHEICITFIWVKNITISILNNTYEMIEKKERLENPESWWTEG